MAERAHPRRSPDSNALLGRPSADPLNTQDTFRALRDMQSFAPQLSQGLAAGQGSLVVAPSQSSVSTGNLVNDGSFNGGSIPGGWDSGSTSLDTSTFYDGTASMAVSYTGGTIYYGRDAGHTYGTMPCAYGQAVYFSFRGLSSGNGEVQVSVYFYNDAGSLVGVGGTPAYNIANADSWALYETSVNVPSGATQFALSISPVAASGTFYVDAVYASLTSVFNGPISTSPSGTGQRVDIFGGQLNMYPGGAEPPTPAVLSTWVDLGTTEAGDRPEVYLAAPYPLNNPTTAAQLTLKGTSADATRTMEALLNALLKAQGGVSGQFITSGTFADRSSGALGSFETVGTATAVASPDLAQRVSIKATATGRTSSNVATAGMNGFTQISISTDNGSTWTTGALVAATTGNVAGSAQNVPWTVECVVSSVIPTGAIKIKLESEQTGGAIGNLAWRTVQWACMAVVSQT